MILRNELATCGDYGKATTESCTMYGFAAAGMRFGMKTMFLDTVLNCTGRCIAARRVALDAEGLPLSWLLATFLGGAH
jgi:hypothetical protein